MYFYPGSHVKETFASAFKMDLLTLVKANEPVSFTMNVQDDEDAAIICRYSSAYEYLTFIAALNAEVSANDVAIVVATDYRPDTVETTILVVCGDEL